MSRPANISGSVQSNIVSASFISSGRSDFSALAYFVASNLGSGTGSSASSTYATISASTAYMRQNQWMSGACRFLFDSFDVPSEATINSVSCTAKIHSQWVTNRPAGVFLYPTSLYGSAVGPNTSVPSGDTFTQVQLSSGTSTWTPEDVNNMEVVLYVFASASTWAAGTYEANIRFYGASVTVNYTYQGIEYEVTTNNLSSNVEVTPSGTTYVIEGGSLTTYFNTDIGFIATDNGDAITLTGPAGAGDPYTYTISNISEDHTILVKNMALYAKTGGSWVSATTVFKKVSGVWVEQSRASYSGLFSTDKIYMDGGNIPSTFERRTLISPSTATVAWNGSVVLSVSAANYANGYLWGEVTAITDPSLITWNITGDTDKGSVNGMAFSAFNPTLSSAAANVSATYNGVTSDPCAITIQAADSIGNRLVIWPSNSIIEDTGTTNINAKQETVVNGSYVLNSVTLSPANVSWSVASGSKYGYLTGANGNTLQGTNSDTGDCDSYYEQTVTVNGTYNGMTAQTDVTVDRVPTDYSYSTLYFKDLDTDTSITSITIDNNYPQTYGTDGYYYTGYGSSDAFVLKGYVYDNDQDVCGAYAGKDETLGQDEPDIDVYKDGSLVGALSTYGRGVYDDSTLACECYHADYSVVNKNLGYYDITYELVPSAPAPNGISQSVDPLYITLKAPTWSWGLTVSGIPTESVAYNEEIQLEAYLTKYLNSSPYEVTEITYMNDRAVAWQNDESYCEWDISWDSDTEYATISNSGYVTFHNATSSAQLVHFSVFYTPGGDPRYNPYDTGLWYSFTITVDPQ